MTPNKEDYLKCIYEIGIDLHKITNKEIAARMQVSPPAVTEMIKRMKSENLILKDKECGYLLTDLGLKLVSELYRKHRLIEVFLVHHLDYTSDQIHEEAEVLEHTVSDLFVERLDKLLGFPKTCPHGGTIPAKGELLVEINNLTLADIKEAGAYRLTRCTIVLTFSIIWTSTHFTSVTSSKSSSLMASAIPSLSSVTTRIYK